MAVYDPRGGGNVHIDVVLSDISVAWSNNGFVGEALFPVVRVRKQSDKYYVFGKEAWAAEPGSDVRAPGTEANEIPGLAVSLQPYFATEHALQIAITDEERENADSPLEPERDGTELVTMKIWLGREKAMHTLVTTAANFASGYSTTLSGTAQWNDYVNSDPIGDVKTGLRTVHSGLFFEPNLAVIPYEVMTKLEDHPDFIERIKYSMPGVLTADIIATLLNVQRVIVPGVGVNNAHMGQAESLGYLWGKDVLLAYVPPRAGLRIPAFGYEFQWVYPGGRSQAADRWREIQRKSDIVRIGRRYDLKLVAQDSSGKAIAGYLIKAAVA